jgi:hypothetical protein
VTTTPCSLASSAWLSEKGCALPTQATGVDWKPVQHILAVRELEPMLANAAYVKNARPRDRHQRCDPVVKA